MFLLKKVKYREILYIENLNIPKLKTTFIFGKSGSGKSTLLKLLNKLISPESGYIYYDKKLMNDISSIDLRRKVVMLGQTPVIFEGSLRDNLLIGLKFSEKKLLSDVDLKFMLELVNLDKELDEDSYNLSGGEKQRLSLVRALLLNPEVLLLDEPSSALDENTEISVISTVLQYCKDNDITPIIVTHSTLLKDTFSEYNIEIEKGKIISSEEV